MNALPHMKGSFLSFSETRGGSPGSPPSAGKPLRIGMSHQFLRAMLGAQWFGVNWNSPFCEIFLEDIETSDWGVEMNHMITIERLAMSQTGFLTWRGPHALSVVEKLSQSPEPGGQGPTFLGVHLEPWLLLRHTGTLQGWVEGNLFHILLRKQVFRNQQDFVPEILKF